MRENLERDKICRGKTEEVFAPAHSCPLAMPAAAYYQRRCICAEVHQCWRPEQEKGTGLKQALNMQLFLCKLYLDLCPVKLLRCIAAYTSMLFALLKMQLRYTLLSVSVHHTAHGHLLYNQNDGSLLQANFRLTTGGSPMMTTCREAGATASGRGGADPSEGLWAEGGCPARSSMQVNICATMRRSISR